MRGKAHFLIGLITGACTFALFSVLLKQEFNITHLFSCVAIGGFMGVFSDVDHRSSHVTWISLGSGLILQIYGYLASNQFFSLLGLGITGIVWFCAMFLPHRGLTHRWWFLLIVSLAFFFTGQVIYVVTSFLAGISHLVADHYGHN